MRIPQPSQHESSVFFRKFPKYHNSIWQLLQEKPYLCKAQLPIVLLMSAKRFLAGIGEERLEHLFNLYAKMTKK